MATLQQQQTPATVVENPEEEDFFGADTSGEETEENFFPAVTPEGKSSDPERFALFASLASQNYGGDKTPEDVKRELENGVGEDAIRKAIAEARNAKQGVDIDQAFYDAMNEKGDEAIKHVKDLAETIVARRNREGVDDKFAVEKGAVDFVSSADLDKQFDETHERILKNSQILESVLQREALVADQAGIAEKVASFLLSFMPLQGLSEAKLLEVPGVEGKPEHFWQIGQEFRGKRNAALNLPTELFEKVVEDYVTALKHHTMAGTLGGKDAVVRGLSDMMAANETDDFSKNFLVGFDAVNTAGIGLAITANALRSPLRALTRANPKVGVDTTVSSALQMKEGGTVAGIKPEHVADEMLPSHLKLNPVQEVGNSGDVAKLMAAKENALARVLLTDHTAGGRMSEAEKASNFTRSVEELSHQYDPSHIKDVKIAERDPLTGSYKMDVFLGKANDVGGFSEEAIAKEMAEARGLTNFEIIKNVDNQFYIKVRSTMSEQTPISIGSISGIKGGMAAPILVPATWMPERWATMFQTSAVRKDLLGSKFKEAVKPIRDLKNSEATQLNFILSRGIKQRKEFTQGELELEYTRAFNRLPTKKEEAAYFAYLDVYEKEGIIRNANQLMHLQRAGFKDIELTAFGTKGQGRIVTRIDDEIVDSPIFDTGSDSLILHGGLTKDALKARLDNGWTLVSLRDSLTRNSNDPFTLVLAKASEMKIHELSPQQIGNIPGGHILYKPKMRFAKQPVTGVYSNGRKWASSPITHAASDNYGKIDNYIEKWNSALTTVKDFKAGKVDEASLNRALERIGVRGLDDWDNRVADGLISENDLFVAVDDGMPMPGSTAGMTNLVGVEPFVDEIERYSFHRNRAFTGKRGADRLHGPEDEALAILDPLETEEIAIQNAVNINAYQNLRIAGMEGWVNLAAPLLRREEGASLFNAFNNPAYIHNPTAEQATSINKLENARKSILRMIGGKTLQEKRTDYLLTKAARWVENKTGKPAGETLRALDVHPIQAMRQLTFNAYLGFGNWHVIPMQASTGIAAAMLHPAAGARANLAYPAMRSAFNSSDKMLTEVLRGVAFQPKEDFALMMKEGRDSGFFTVGKGHLRMDAPVKMHLQPSGVLGQSLGDFFGGVKKHAQSSTDALQLFFMEPERYNRSIAWNMAWHESKEKFGQNILSNAARDFRIRRSDALIMHMTSASRTALTEGAAGLFTQFKHYPWHVLQESYGPYSSFTGSERWRFPLVQLVIAGSAAVPLGRTGFEALSKWYEDTTGTQMNEDVYRTFSSGAFDELFSLASGGDIQSAYGMQVGAGTLVDQLKDLALNKPLIETFEGAALPFVTGIAKKAANAIEYLAWASNDGLTVEEMYTAAMDVAREFAVVNKAERDYLMWKTNKIFSKSGAFISATNPAETVAAILGIAPRATYDTRFLYEQLSSSKDRSQKDVKRVLEWRVRAALADTDAQKKAIANMEAFYQKDWTPAYRFKVMSEVNSKMPEDTWLNLGRRVYEEEGRVTPAVRSIGDRTGKKNTEGK